MASNFEFYSPTRVIFGKGTEQRVGALVREYGGTRVLVVYGGKSAIRSGVLDRAEKSLAEAGLSSWKCRLRPATFQLGPAHRSGRRSCRRRR